MSAGNEALKNEMQRQKDLLKKLRMVQERAYEDGNESQAATSARKITKIIGAIKDLEKQIAQCEIKSEQDRKTEQIQEKKLISMIKKFKAIRTNTDYLWYNEISGLLGHLHNSLKSVGESTSSIQDSFSSFLGTISGTEKRQQKRYSSIELVNQISKRIHGWTDMMEQNIISLDSINIADFNLTTNRGGTNSQKINQKLADIKAARKQEIKRIQGYMVLLEEAGKQMKAIINAHRFLAQFSVDSKNLPPSRAQSNGTHPPETQKQRSRTAQQQIRRQQPTYMPRSPPPSRSVGNDGLSRKLYQSR
mmetsp:Transcript_24007/g.42534  ORF Transcript_24007/g.42534 Transcript_24007/m.42534 type:complete len:305 (+) Transcript_24007:130-1044(+)|eukprot:CAMPEP_0197518282 /NCGR_PEP_ID=MMETSP1318-20131121/3434_1 /TAXON_ID=552666 /ORGANISM="Partenskyella glossopodia, Strain RCC365" /LENGTH=304 /DNA_ID=CAMNT_0043068493 /DNA_START=103 /DNA_END=1017 /DNA_ORIENTATION=-